MCSEHVILSFQKFSKRWVESPQADQQPNGHTNTCTNKQTHKQTPQTKSVLIANATSTHPQQYSYMQQGQRACLSSAIAYKRKRQYWQFAYKKGRVLWSSWIYTCGKLIRGIWMEPIAMCNMFFAF